MNPEEGIWRKGVSCSCVQNLMPYYLKEKKTQNPGKNRSRDSEGEIPLRNPGGGKKVSLEDNNLLSN